MPVHQDLCDVDHVERLPRHDRPLFGEPLMDYQKDHGQD